MKPTGRSIGRRVWAVGVSIAYAVTNVAGVHAGEVAFWGERRGTANRFTQKPLEDIKSHPLLLSHSILPFGDLRIAHASNNPDAPLVIHIQDIHGNWEAQQNMAQIVLALAQDHGVRLVGLEGATGAFATDEFRPYPDQDAVMQSGAFFMKKDLIGGPEYAGLVSVPPITLWGIEDPALYSANAQAVRDALAAQPETDVLLASLDKTLATLKKSIYNDELKNLDENKSLYDQGKLKLGEYLQRLARFKGQDKPSLSMQFPNVARFLEALSKEEKLVFSDAEQERKNAVQLLTKKLSAGAIQDLMNRSLDLRKGMMSHDAYNAYLKDLCAKSGVALTNFPSLTAYMEYAAQSETIQREALLEEIDRLEASLQESLSSTREQKILVGISRDVLCLGRLLTNTMTPEDWTAYSARREEVLNIASRFGSLGAAAPNPEELHRRVTPYETFCAKAMDRNGALADRLLAKMADENRSVAVLVAGGFHTEGVVKWLAHRDATVAVITPKIGQADLNHRYLDAFANDPAPLEKLFAGQPISLKLPCGLALRGGGEKIIDLLHTIIVGRILSKTKNGEFLSPIRQNLSRLTAINLSYSFDRKKGLTVSFHFGDRQVDLKYEKDAPFPSTFSYQSEPKLQSFLTVRSAEKMVGALLKPFLPRPEREKPKPLIKGYYAELPGTAMPGIVGFLDKYLSIPQNKSVYFHALVLESILFVSMFILIGGALPYLSIPRLFPVDLALYAFLSVGFSDFRKSSFLFNRATGEWVVDNTPSDLSKFILRWMGFIYNAPFLLLIPLLQTFHPFVLASGIILTIEISVLIRMGFQTHRQDKELEEIKQQAYSLINAYHNGNLSSQEIPSAFHHIANLENGLATVASNYIRKAITAAEKGPVIRGNSYRAYEIDSLGVVLKIPIMDPHSGHAPYKDIQKSCALIKPHLGGLFAPFTVLENYAFEGKTLPLVLIHQKVASLNTMGSNSSPPPAELHRVRTASIGEIKGKISEMGLGYASDRTDTINFGTIENEKVVCIGYDQISSKTSSENIGRRRVPDVLQSPIRKEQLKWLMGQIGSAEIKINEGPRNNTGEFPFIRSAAKILIGLVVPILETNAYEALSHKALILLGLDPSGVGVLAAILISTAMGFLSASIHWPLWKIQKESVDRSDFFRWWVLGTLFTLPFIALPAALWHGDAAWLASWAPHIAINVAIILGWTARLGKKLHSKWLADLKPGSVFKAPNASMEDGSETQPAIIEILRNKRRKLLMGQTRSPEGEAVGDLICHLVAQFQSAGGKGLDRDYLLDVVGRVSNGRILSHALLSTAGAVVSAVLKSPRYESKRVLEYILRAQTWNELLAMNPDTDLTQIMLDKYMIYFHESSAQLDKTAVSDLSIKFRNSIRPETPKSSSEIADIPVSPVPGVLPFNLVDSHTERPLLEDGVLGGQLVSLQLGAYDMRRTYQVDINEPGSMKKREIFRSYLRDRVMEHAPFFIFSDDFASTSRMDLLSEIGPNIFNGRLKSDVRDYWRQWALAEFWLAGATWKDRMSWQYWKLYLREQLAFGWGKRFSTRDRMARAVTFTALLRGSKSSLLETQYDDFDLDLLFGCAATSNGPVHELLNLIVKTYNNVLGQGVRFDLWKELARAITDKGVLIFDIDAFIQPNVSTEIKQEVATALSGALLAWPKGQLKDKIFLVTSQNRSSSKNIAGNLSNEFGSVFTLVNELTIVSPEEVKNLVERTDTFGATGAVIHLKPLINHLFPKAQPAQISFWTHDKSHVSMDGLRDIILINIMPLARSVTESLKKLPFIKQSA